MIPFICSSYRRLFRFVRFCRGSSRAGWDCRNFWRVFLDKPLDEVSPCITYADQRDHMLFADIQLLEISQADDAQNAGDKADEETEEETGTVEIV